MSQQPDEITFVFDEPVGDIDVYWLKDQPYGIEIKVSGEDGAPIGACYVTDPGGQAIQVRRSAEYQVTIQFYPVP